MGRRISLQLAVLWLMIGGLNYQAALALSTDSEQPIHIEADQAELDNRKQVAIYHGNVHLTQGTLRIDADTLTIYYTPEKELEKAIAEGQPAWYRQRPDNSNEDVRARALRMEYHADTNTVYLFQKAHVWQGANEFTGDRIEYDIKHDIVRGEGSEAGTGRVHVIIRPGVNDARPDQAAPENAASSLGAPPAEQTAGNEGDYQAQAHGRTTTWLNLRTGPGTDYNKAGLIPPRIQVAILERQGDWLRITLLMKGERMEGWAHANYIRLQDMQKD